MFGIEALDVVIGMIFIYLLFSLFVTILNEGISSALQVRGKELQFVLFQMLGSTLLKSFYENDRIKKGMIKSRFRFAKTIFDPHNDKDITANEENRTNNRSVLPSEIDSMTFVEVLSEEIKNELMRCEESIREQIDPSNQTPYTFQGLINELSDSAKLQTVLDAVKDNKIDCKAFKNEQIKKIFQKGITSLNHLQNELEKWYDEMMLFLIDWYKRKLRFILMGLGFLIAAFFNVDSISIFKTLVNDPEARAAIVEQAESYVSSHNIDPQTGLPVPIKTGDKSIDTVFVSGNTGALLFLDARKSNCNERKSCLDSLELSYPTLFKLEKSYVRLDSLVNNEIASANATLGIGWNSMIHYNWDSDESCFVNILCCIWHYFKILFGWIITAIALSMGAPFWYDLLRKVVNIKNELKGKRTEKERVG